ncbi:MAG: hypothetical protein JXO22_06455 [Phycisphaerae bacterium]|nr:hypothetical protein [Phycisphaerae bacterium]
MATKSAIGKMRQDALDRMVAAMQVFNDLFSLPPLHLDRIIYHDPAYQEAARLTALADWLHELLDVVDAPDADNPDVRLGLVRLVLDAVLREHTVAKLQELADQFDIALGDATRKDDLVRVIAEALTGKAIQVVDEGEIPVNLLPPVAVNQHYNVLDVPDGKALRVYAVETAWPPAPAEELAEV